MLVLLHPEAWWLALLLIPLLYLGASRLTGLSRLRRYSALLLQTVSALLLIASLAQPALMRPDDKMSLVLVLDASASLSKASRDQAVAYATKLLKGQSQDTSVHFVSVAGEAVLLTPEQVSTGNWAEVAQVQSHASDLAAGLRLANSLLSDSGRRRIVLLTDGWETRGSAAGEAAHISARGIDLQIVA